MNLLYYSILKHSQHNSIILYHIWYLLHDELTVLYIFHNTPSVDISMPYEFNHYKTRITVLQYSTTLSSIIASFCITFDNCYLMNQQYIYITVYSQFWYQHAVMNVVTKRREFTLLEYSTTLSSLITSFCIIFNIWCMMNK